MKEVIKRICIFDNNVGVIFFERTGKGFNFKYWLCEKHMNIDLPSRLLQNYEIETKDINGRI